MALGLARERVQAGDLPKELEREGCFSHMSFEEGPMVLSSTPKGCAYAPRQNQVAFGSCFFNAPIMAFSWPCFLCM